MLRALVSTIAVVFCAGAVFAQAPKNGDEFQVNEFTDADQIEPAVAVAPNGDFVVTWQGWASSGSDDSYDSIHAQRFAADGTPSGAEFQVNTFTFYRQTEPAVAMGPAGDFVVVWNSDPAAGDTYWSIEAQRYDASGAPIGGQFRVNAETANRQDKAAISAAPDGRFVVVWESRGSTGTDTELMSIQAQRFASDGTPLGGQFQVNTYTTGQQLLPAVGVDANGAFLVVWQSTGSSGTDTSETSILGQKFNAGGTPLGPEIQVNSFTTGEQVLPTVASNPDRNFLIMWQSDGSPGDDTSSSSIQGQRYGPTGAAQGDQFQVNAYTTGSQVRPSLTADPTGQWVASWRSSSSPGDDDSSTSIQGQRFEFDGTTLGEQFQVNSYTTSSQMAASVAADPNGGFVVVWDSATSAGTDSSGRSIQGQRYLPTLIFSDGFESGDTSAWSQAVP